MTQKRNADAVDDGSHAEASKKPRVKKAGSLDDDDDHSIHHRYRSEPPADLTVTFKKHKKKKHVFHLHQAIMANEAKYFANLIDTKDQEHHIVVYLPLEFEWSPEQFDQFVQTCYRQLDDVLVSLAYAPDLKSFGEMWFRKDAVLTAVNGEAGVENKWKVVGHTTEGIADCQNSTQHHKKLQLHPGACKLKANMSAFHQQLAADVDIMIQLEIATYFCNSHLIKLLLAIALKLIAMG